MPLQLTLSAQDPSDLTEIARRWSFRYRYLEVSLPRPPASPGHLRNLIARIKQRSKGTAVYRDSPKKFLANIRHAIDLASMLTAYFLRVSSLVRQPVGHIAVRKERETDGDFADNRIDAAEALTDSYRFSPCVRALRFGLVPAGA